MDNRQLPVIAILSSLFTISGCDSFDFSVTSQEPEMMCSGDTLAVTAEASKRASRIRIYSNTGELLYSEPDVRTVELTVPDVQPSDLQFKVVAKKKRRFWPDTKIELNTDFKLFDNPRWYNDGGLLPTSIDFEPDANVTLIEETRGNPVCMEWNIDTDECTHFENVQSSRACFAVKEFFYTYQGASWNLHAGTHYSDYIKASKVRNLADRPVTVTVSGTGTQGGTVQPNATFTFTPPVVPGSADVSLDIPVDEQEKRLCKKVTLRINCGSDVPLKDFPAIEECFDIPTIDMELFCEQAP